MDNENCRILIVDDEADVLEFLGYNLRKENYDVYTAKNGEEALTQVKSIRPHLIILDVMMPGMDGMEVCRRIKEMPELKNTIVVFLTARGEDYSQLAGFAAGADDYITKPVKPGILISRVKAWLRRYKNEIEPGKLLILRDITIDREKYLIVKQDQEIRLPRKEFELLSLLTSRVNKVFTRDEIYSKVWGHNVVVGERTIDVHVRKLREKLGIANITTIKGVGYKYEE